MSCQTGNINHLPDLCLLKIMDKLPLRKLLPLNQVCRRWSCLVKSACCRRRCLTLFIGNKPSQLLANSQFAKQVSPSQTFNSLSYEIMVWGYANWIVATLPNVKQLVIAANGINSTAMNYIIYMLTHWAHKMTSVRLYINFVTSYNASEESSIFRTTHRVFQLFNRMSRLRHLMFESPRYYSNNRFLFLPVLSQLEHFYFYTRDSLNFVFGSLKKYGQTNDRLKQIGFGISTFDNELLKRFMGLQAQLAVRFTQLSFIFLPSLAQYELNQFCRHFSSLNSLTISVDQLSLSQLSNSLVSLKALKSLNMTVDFTCATQPFWFEDTLPFEEFSPLSSVKNLHLRIWSTSHIDLKSCHLASIFPQLETIAVEGFFDHCDLCGDTRTRQVPKDKLHQCLKYMFGSFKQFAKLQSIVSLPHSQVFTPDQL